MKSFAILLPVLFSMNLMAAQPILNNNDIVTPTTLKYDVDGFEMWTIIPSDREETLKAFKTKCEETIPNRYAERIALLGVSKDDFVYSTKIETNYFRRLGNQYICRAEVKILNTVEYNFNFDYSKIITQSPYETCKAMVHDLDQRVYELSLFDRRAYFDLDTNQPTEIIYKRCQVLAIKLNRK